MDKKVLEINPISTYRKIRNSINSRVLRFLKVSQYFIGIIIKKHCAHWKKLWEYNWEKNRDSGEGGGKV